MGACPHRCRTHGPRYASRISPNELPTQTHYERIQCHDGDRRAAVPLGHPRTGRRRSVSTGGEGRGRHCSRRAKRGRQIGPWLLDAGQCSWRPQRPGPTSHCPPAQLVRCGRAGHHGRRSRGRPCCSHAFAQANRTTTIEIKAQVSGARCGHPTRTARRRQIPIWAHVGELRRAHRRIGTDPMSSPRPIARRAPAGGERRPV
jgi:hypothetical protein